MPKAAIFIISTPAVAMLVGCARAPERPVTWVPPPGISGRDVIRDKAVCNQLSETEGPTILSAALYQEAKRKFFGCMREAGYTDVTH